MEQNFFDIDPRLEKLGEQAQLDCAQAFARTEEIGEYNSRKVLAAFLHNGVSESHFAGSTGYGYDDRGRETLEAVMAEITGSEDALMRHNFVSGTHTLTTALFGVLRPGDVMLLSLIHICFSCKPAFYYIQSCREKSLLLFFTVFDTTFFTGKRKGTKRWNLHC